MINVHACVCRWVRPTYQVFSSLLWLFYCVKKRVQIVFCVFKKTHPNRVAYIARKKTLAWRTHFVSAGINFRRKNLTSIDVIFWRVIPERVVRFKNTVFLTGALVQPTCHWEIILLGSRWRITEHRIWLVLWLTRRSIWLFISFETRKRNSFTCYRIYSTIGKCFTRYRT